MNVQDTVFILGCQRSGTTLLRLVLGAHPDVAGVDEAIAYLVLGGRKRLEDEIGTQAHRPHVAYKIPRFTEQLLEADVRDEVYGTLPHFYSFERAVFVVRDPRDVVASMLSLKAGPSRTWIQAYGRVTIEHRASTREGFATRYATELAALERHRWPDHLTAAMYWKLKNDALPTYLEAGLPLLPVRYEDLVRAPKLHLQRMLQHLGIAWDPAVLRHQDADRSQLGEDGLTIGGSDPSRAIDDTSVGRHAGVLDQARLLDLEEWVEPTKERIAAALSEPS